jgi:hypothetical protein
MKGWKDSKEGGGVFIILFLGGCRLDNQRVDIYEIASEKTSVIEEASNMSIS